MSQIVLAAATVSSPTHSAKGSAGNRMTGTNATFYSIGYDRADEARNILQSMIEAAQADGVTADTVKAWAKEKRAAMIQGAMDRLQLDPKEKESTKTARKVVATEYSYVSLIKGYIEGMGEVPPVDATASDLRSVSEAEAEASDTSEDAEPAPVDLNAEIKRMIAAAKALADLAPDADADRALNTIRKVTIQMEKAWMSLGGGVL